MKPRLVILFIVFTGLLFSSCKKNTEPIIAEVATLNLVNALSGSTDLIANFNNQLPYYNYQTAVYYGSSLPYYVAGSNYSVSLRQSSDTLHTVYNQTLTLSKNTVQSLFITGTIDSPESVLVTDNLPYHGPQGHGAADSVAGIRFANMLTGSAPVSVNIVGNDNGSEVSSLDYKSLTDFKNYSTVSTISSYQFEFRDAGSGALLGSYTLSGVNNGTNGNTSTNNVRFKNLTIVLSGVAGGLGANAPMAFLVKNY